MTRPMGHDTIERSDGFAPAKRSLGQNFLVDPNISAKIVGRLRIGSEDTVIEIGPGRGALSGHILAAGPRAYLALEKDRELAARLPHEHPGAHPALVDALRLDWSRLDALDGVKLVGNLPYNIASPLLWDICSQASRFAVGVFMVQHEVALRLCAAPGGKQYGALTAWTSSFARFDYCFKVPPGVFRPQPKVDSAVVAVTPRPALERPEDPAGLATLLKRLFSMRRKQLAGILKPHWDDALAQACAGHGIEGRVRPETLTPGQFQQLAKLLKTRLPS